MRLCGAMDGCEREFLRRSEPLRAARHVPIRLLLQSLRAERVSRSDLTIRLAFYRLDSKS